MAETENKRIKKHNISDEKVIRNDTNAYETWVQDEYHRGLGHELAKKHRELCPCAKLEAEKTELYRSWNSEKIAWVNQNEQLKKELADAKREAECSQGNALLCGDMVAELKAENAELRKAMRTKR